MSNMNMCQPTALGGTLIRWADDTWAWSDHTPAPQVKDARPSWYYNFRICQGMVEVPVKVAAAEPELSWVRSGGYRTGLSGDHGSTRTLHMDGRETRTSDSGKAIPAVYLVPVKEWDEWNAKTVIGPKWDKVHEAAILTKAESLGWGLPMKKEKKQ